VVPLLTHFTRMTHHQAVGTSTAAVVMTGTAGCASFGTSGAVDIVAAVAIASTAMLAAGAGAKLTSRFSGVQLARVFAVFQLSVAPLVRARRVAPCAASASGVCVCASDVRVCASGVRVCMNAVHTAHLHAISLGCACKYLRARGTRVRAYACAREVAQPRARVLARACYFDTRAPSSFNCSCSAHACRIGPKDEMLPRVPL